MDRATPQVIIVGAGITGLSLAWRLAEHNVSFTILEQSNRPGGQIHTLHENGYTFESGPNTGSISNPEVAELFDFASPYASLEEAASAAHCRLICKKGKLHVLPSGLLSGLSTPLFSFSDKLRVACEPFRAKGNNPLESVGALAQRRLGKSIVDYAVDPFVGGIYASDPYFLTAQYALPKLYNLEQEYGSFIRGALAKAKIKKSERERRATKAVFSSKGGLQNLVEALAHKLSQQGSLCYSTTIESVRYTAEGNWQISYHEADKESQIVEAPFYVTTVRGDLLRDVLPPVLYDHLAPIEQLLYAPIWEIAVGFDHYKGDGRRAFGALIPTKEKRDLLGVLFPSDCFSDRVPYKDSRLFTLFMGGLRDGNRFISLSEEELQQKGLKDLYALLRIPHSLEPSMVHLSYFPKAIPQYGIDSEERLKAIMRLESDYPGLYLAGGIRDGIGMAHRIKQGSDLALEIIQKLQR